MKDMQQVGLTVSLSHVTSNREPYHYSTLRIDDRRSGFTIVEIDLTPQQVYDLMISRGTFYPDGIPGQVISEDAFPHVGKTMHVFTRLFQLDHEVEDFPRDKPGSSPHLDSWGRMVMGTLWASSFSWSMRNNGVSFAVRRYSNDLTPELAEKAQKMLDLYPAPKGLK